MCIRAKEIDFGKGGGGCRRLLSSYFQYSVIVMILFVVRKQGGEHLSLYIHAYLDDSIQLGSLLLYRFILSGFRFSQTILVDANAITWYKIGPVTILLCFLPPPPHAIFS